MFSKYKFLQEKLHYYRTMFEKYILLNKESKFSYLIFLPRDKVVHVNITNQSIHNSLATFVKSHNESEVSSFEENHPHLFRIYGMETIIEISTVWKISKIRILLACIFVYLELKNILIQSNYWKIRTRAKIRSWTFFAQWKCICSSWLQKLKLHSIFA